LFMISVCLILGTIVAVLLGLAFGRWNSFQNE
jgi:hypothetical protein